MYDPANYSSTSCAKLAYEIRDSCQTSQNMPVMRSPINGNDEGEVRSNKLVRASGIPLLHAFPCEAEGSPQSLTATRTHRGCMQHIGEPDFRSRVTATASACGVPGPYGQHVRDLSPAFGHPPRQRRRGYCSNRLHPSPLGFWASHPHHRPPLRDYPERSWKKRLTL